MVGMRFALLAVSVMSIIGGAAFFFSGAKASSAYREAPAQVETPGPVAAQDLIADASDLEAIRKCLAMPVMSDLENRNFVRAAGRRYMRRKLQYEQAERLVAAGSIPAASLASLREEVESARRVCDVAEGMGHTESMIAMAQSSFDLELRLANMPSMKGLAEKYDGSGTFSEADLEMLEREFKTTYGHALPVSARGEGPVHRSMGFDHTGRFDVALNPSDAEGMWVRRYLTGKGVPFLAFRGAVRGQATGAHIHIGKPSTRAPKV
jgi:hypothetical protein